MSCVRLVIRDVERDIYADRHGAFADRVIAALSAEPETIEELEVAVERFEAPGETGFFHGFRRGLRDEPYDAGLVVVDLAARLIVCDSTYSWPGRDGDVTYHDGHCATDTSLRYHLPDDWKITSESFTIGSLDCRPQKIPYWERELPAERRDLIDRLSRDFGNLREVMQSSDLATAAALVDPVLDRFRESLDALAAAANDLEPRLHRTPDPSPPIPRTAARNRR
jgi:hypothetical protein